MRRHLLEKRTMRCHLLERTMRCSLLAGTTMRCSLLEERTMMCSLCSYLFEEDREDDEGREDRTVPGCDGKDATTKHVAHKDLVQPAENV